MHVPAKPGGGEQQQQGQQRKSNWVRNPFFRASNAEPAQHSGIFGSIGSPRWFHSDRAVGQRRASMIHKLRMGPFLDFADKEMETAIQQHRNGMPTRFRFVFNFCAFGMLLFGLL